MNLKYNKKKEKKNYNNSEKIEIIRKFMKNLKLSTNFKINKI